MSRYRSRFGQSVPDGLFEHIWDHLYKVRVPYLATMSEEYIKQFGVPTSGDKKIDREQMRQLITTYMPIAKMVDLFKQGTNIRLVEPDAPKKIYEAVSKYLDYCRDILENEINVADAPLEDLLAMDHFANSVYEHAKYHMVSSNPSSHLANALSKFTGFRFRTDRLSLLPSAQLEQSINPVTVGENQEQSINDLPKRESLADLFKDQMVNGIYRR
jgi:hypothetical protein